MWEADKKLNWDVTASDKKLGDLLGITRSYVNYLMVKGYTHMKRLFFFSLKVHTSEQLAYYVKTFLSAQCGLHNSELLLCLCTKQCY